MFFFTLVIEEDNTLNSISNYIFIKEIQYNSCPLFSKQSFYCDIPYKKYTYKVPRLKTIVFSSFSNRILVTVYDCMECQCSLLL